MKISGARAGAPPAAGRVFAALNRYSLKSLLIGSVGLVVLFCVLVVVYVRVSQRIAFRMVDSLITVDNVISDLCLKSTAAMIDARRLEKDFLLNYREYGFDESRSRYITRLVAGVAEIKGNMDRIRELAGDRETADRPGSSRARSTVSPGCRGDGRQARGARLPRLRRPRGVGAEARGIETLVEGSGATALLASSWRCARRGRTTSRRERTRTLSRLRRRSGTSRRVAAARLPRPVRIELTIARRALPRALRAIRAA